MRPRESQPDLAWSWVGLVALGFSRAQTIVLRRVNEVLNRMPNTD